MKRLLFSVVLGFAMFGFLAPLPVRAADDSRESVLKDMIAVLGKMSDLLEGVKDEGSIEAATATLKKLQEEMTTVMDRMRNFGPTDTATDEALKAKFEPEIKAAQQRFMTALQKMQALGPKAGALLGNMAPAQVQGKAQQTMAINNARQVILYLKIYATDNGGAFPDAHASKPATSNDAFRLMFVQGDADSEMIFACPLSKLGKPDGKIGSPPTFAEAVKAGENHWAMAKGLTDSDGSVPLIFENPADTSWPPKWDVDAAGTDAPGRPWPDRTVIVGFTDGSVQRLPLDPSVKSGKAGLAPRADGTPIFPDIPGRKLEVLNVAK